MDERYTKIYKLLVLIHLYLEGVGPTATKVWPQEIKSHPKTLYYGKSSCICTYYARDYFLSIERVSIGC